LALKAASWCDEAHLSGGDAAFDGLPGLKEHLKPENDPTHDQTGEYCHGKRRSLEPGSSCGNAGPEADRERFDPDDGLDRSSVNGASWA
jgi:hypothetical protein